jgi:hypothetical protein
MPALRRQPRKAVVLLAVLVVVVLLSLAAYKYSDYMMSEYRATDSAVRASQARLAADSGIAYVTAYLAGNIDQTLGGNPYENPSMFQNIPIPSTDPKARPMRFSILSLRSPVEAAAGGRAYRVGVTDEGGKINLNALLALDRNRGNAGLAVLKGLPNMSEDIAKSILAWLGCTQFAGTESAYYSQQSPPYRMKNGPLDSLEELLLVRGVTPQLLFGNDRNRNGILDPDESDGGGAVDLGWSAYLTVYSREANADVNNKARININGQDLNALADQLAQAVGDDLANYIVAYRLYGGSSTSGSGDQKSSGSGDQKSGSGDQKSSGSGDQKSGSQQKGDTQQKGGNQQPAATSTATPLSDSNRSAVMSQIQKARSSGGSQQKLSRIRSLWDLVNSQVNVDLMANGESQTIAYPSPLNKVDGQRELLPLLLDRCTTSNRTDLRPRINVATAPDTVLSCLRESTGLTDADVSNIIGKRPALESGNTELMYKSTAWLMTECQLPVATMKRLDPYLTGRTQVYRVQSIGYFERGGPVARVEAVIDTNLGRPRIVFWRELTELGRGFDPPREQTQ